MRYIYIYIYHIYIYCIYLHSEKCNIIITYHNQTNIMHSITLHNLKHTYLLLAPGSAAEKWSSSEAWELTYSELGPLMAPWTFVETLLLNEPLISDLLFFGKGRQALFVSPRKKKQLSCSFFTQLCS